MSDSVLAKDDIVGMAPSVLGVIGEIQKKDEPEPMTDEEIMERMNEMVPRLSRLSEIERDVINAHEQRISCSRRFVSAVKRGDKEDAATQLIRWCQLAARVEEHNVKLVAGCTAVLAEINEE